MFTLYWTQNTSYSDCLKRLNFPTRLQYFTFTHGVCGKVKTVQSKVKLTKKKAISVTCYIGYSFCVLFFSRWVYIWNISSSVIFVWICWISCHRCNYKWSYIHKSYFSACRNYCQNAHTFRSSVLWRQYSYNSICFIG